VKRRRSVRPGVPSVAGGHSRSCVNRCRSRDRGHVCFRDDPALIRPFARRSRKLRLTSDPGLLQARSPSPPTFSHRDVYAMRMQALLWIRLTPNDFCNCIPTHGHTPEHPILAVASGISPGDAPETALHHHRASKGSVSSPRRGKVVKMPRAVSIPSKPKAPPAMQERKER